MTTADYGINAGGGVLATNNVAYGQLGSVGGGLAAGLAAADTFWITSVTATRTASVMTGGLAEANTIYGNTDRGIYFNHAATMIGNVIFDNRAGAVVTFRGEASNNLIYNNTDYGIFAAGGDTDIRNNTIYQPQGDGSGSRPTMCG